VLINKLQAVKRQRALSNNEIAELVKSRKKKKQESSIQCAIAILLDEKEEAKRLFKTLSKNERRQITDYPINTLFKR